MVLDKDYYWDKVRGLTKAREHLVNMLIGNLLHNAYYQYMETDDYRGIIDTCNMITREIEQVNKSIEALQLEEQS